MPCVVVDDAGTLCPVPRNVTEASTRVIFAGAVHRVVKMAPGILPPWDKDGREGTRCGGATPPGYGASGYTMGPVTSDCFNPLSDCWHWACDGASVAPLPPWRPPPPCPPGGLVTLVTLVTESPDLNMAEIVWHCLHAAAPCR